MPFDNTNNEFSFRALGGCDLPHPFFEFTVGGFKGIKNVVHIGPRIMFSFMPTFGALF